MKIASLSFSILGTLCILMAALTALGASPAFIGEALVFGENVTTTAFWAGGAALLLLAGIAFGVITPKE